MSGTGNVQGEWSWHEWNRRLSHTDTLYLSIYLSPSLSVYIYMILYMYTYIYMKSIGIGILRAVF